jgi:tripartite-type tricarboxylate transporter receptor subunit TctC
MRAEAEAVQRSRDALSGMRLTFMHAVMEVEMNRRIFSIALLSSLFAFLFLSRWSFAVPYYEGKVIKIVVGHEVGGGYDRLARLIAKHLPKHIPGKPTVLVDNMPGAQTMIAANYIFNLAKPDGLTITTLDRGIPFAQLLKLEGVKFDVTKFSWVGSAASETMILALRTDFPFKSVEDLRRTKEPIPLGGVGAGASDTQFPVLLKEFAGLNLKIINYPSSAASILAVEKKEVEGRAGSYSSLKTYIERNLVRPVIRSRVPDPEITQLPVNEDLTSSPLGKTLMAMMAAADRIGRPYVAPPGTPAEAMSLLREGFSRVAKDPEALEEAQKIRMGLLYTSADEALKTMHYVLSQPENVVREFAKYIKF